MNWLYRILGIFWLTTVGNFSVATNSLATNNFLAEDKLLTDKTSLTNETSPSDENSKSQSLPKLPITPNVNNKDNDSLTTPKFDFQGPYITLGVSQVELRSALLNNAQAISNSSVSESFVGLGYQLNHHWAFEAQYLTSSVNYRDQSIDDLSAFDVNVLYRFENRAEDSWHLRFGVGARQFDTAQYFPESDTVIKLGGGYDFHLNNNLFITLFAETQRALDREQSDLQYGVSLNYFFGFLESATTNQTQIKPQQESAPVQQDDDNDGIINQFDKCPDTPFHYMVDATGCTQFIIDRESVVLNVKFPLDSDVVDDRYREDIASLARFMRQHKTLSISIEGHTDDIGPAEYNLKLSTQRAKAVAHILSTEFGIETARISYVGFGEEKPLAENINDMARAKNRRVMAVLSIEVSRPQLKK